ncbi:MAG TPA: peptide MFS transporter [Bryobacteraceae bacterium]|jgi:POT family proton-dependent oligopeptide transporter
MPAPASETRLDTTSDTRFFGHPRGLSTLFFTEMWERFGFYGVRAILVYFMTATLAQGGLGFSTAKAGIIYGMFLAMVYLLSLPGGWLADNILGQQRSVLYGGIVIAIGWFIMALPGEAPFYTALTLVTFGTGMLKPNVSTIVGGLYSPGDKRRDAGFSIFYMGINVGALISPLICGYVGEKINYRWGLALAGVGMTAGLIQYSLGTKYLGKAGLPPPVNPQARRQALLGAVTIVILAGVVAALASAGVIHITPDNLSDAVGLFLTVLTLLVFGWLLKGANWTSAERGKLAAIIVFFIASALFWSAFEQAGSTLSLFAQRNTRLSIFGWDFPASWFQSLNSIFLVIMAPVFAAMWIKMGKREPSTTTKFAWGLIFVGLGFAVLIPVANQTGVSPMWLTLTYFLHTIGELSLSPVGLSAMTKLAPQRIGALVMGIWFLSISVGEFIGGRVAAVYEKFPLSLIFGAVAGFSIVVGLLLFTLVRPVSRMTGDVN